MSDTRLENSLLLRITHGWAVLTVVATVCLLALGAVVTTFGVGMTDPVWPTVPWHLALISYDEPRTGYIIEHSHRLAGYLVGCCAIVLALLGTVCGLVSSSQRRGWLVGLGWAVLLCVILQGLLGGFRVVLNALFGREFAAVHGIFAQVVFSLIVSTAVLSSGAFRRPSHLGAAEARSLFRLSLLLTASLFVQLVWGSLTRHTFHPLAQRLHILTAFVVVAVVAWFVKTVWESPAAWQRLRVPAVLLVVLVGLQLMLGVEAWLGHFGTGELPDMVKLTPPQAVIRTAHVLLGSWLLALSVSCTLLTGGAKAPRLVSSDATEPAQSVHPLKAIA